MPASPKLASFRLILILAAASALDAMAIDMYTPGFPALQKHFGISVAAVQASLSLFLIGQGIGQAIYGPLLDRCGRRGPMLTGMAAFAIGSLLCAMSGSFAMFLVGRCLQSIGAASAMIAPRAVVADVYETKDTARIFSILMQVIMISPVVAPLLGGVIVTHLGWRAIFAVLALFGVATFLVSCFFLPETLPKERRVVRPPGRVLTAYGQMFLRPRFVLYTLSTGLVGGSIYAYLGGSSFALIEDYGLSPSRYSLVFAAIAVGLILAGWLNIALLRRLNEGLVLSIGLMVHFAASAALLAISAGDKPPFELYAPLLFVAVSASGLVFGNVTALTMAHAGAEAGMGSAVLGVAQSFISALAGVVIGVTGADARGLAMAMALFAGLAWAAKEAAAWGETREARSTAS